MNAHFRHKWSEGRDNQTMKTNNNPIGVFDSGIGGLSVWKELRKALPHESIVYLADGKNCPYGDKSAEEVEGFVLRAIEELLRHNVKLIVVACNTATAVAIDLLREKYSIPFVGMEPAVKPAALTSESGVIGILATRSSLQGDLFRNTCAKYADKVKILSAVGEGFVECVESGEENDTEVAEPIVRRAVMPLLREGADKIVLGCTHYPFLVSHIEKLVEGQGVEIINPAPAVARRTAWLLSEHKIKASESHKAEYRFVTFADDGYLAKITDKAMQLAEM